MPRLADHEQRRAEILEALLRIAGTRGLYAASMRTVAAEAGVTVSTVQYYFRTKEELLFAGLQHLAEAVGRRAAARLPADSDAPIRTMVESWLSEFIPVDDEQRSAYVVFAAYHALALTDPALAALPYTRSSGALEEGLRDLLDRARRAGQVAADRDVAAEAGNLLALATGLGNSVMAGMRSAEEALGLLRYHLAQLLPPDRR